MKGLKHKVRILLVIILVCFTVIPFFLTFLKTNEGMTYDMKDKNISMDAIELNRGPFNMYGYCLGGEFKCENGVSPNLVGTYNDRNGKTHNIYSGVCGDCKEEEKNSEGDCYPGTEELIKCEMTNNVNKFDTKIDYEKDPNNPKKKFTFDPGIGLITPPWKNDDERLKKRPDQYLPWDISNGYVYLYDPDNVTVDASFTACYLYESKEDCDKKLESNKENSDEIPVFRCIADNGSKTGDPLCCGQDGVLQNTKHNCPSEYPKCVGYKCGESWGKCVEK